MSVYTKLSLKEMQKFTSQFDFGGLKDFKGVEAGVENTTYFVSFERCETVLQIFEEQNFHEIPFFIKLNKRLAEDEMPVASPLMNRSGAFVFDLKGKPAALFIRLPGNTLKSTDTTNCACIGRILGKMHLKTQAYLDLRRENHRWNDWWEKNVDRVLDFIDPSHQSILKDQVQRSKLFVSKSIELPSGIIHGDLFCDNAMFDGNQLTGIIDFYNSCNGAFIFDLAIALNDWCSEQDGRLNPKKTRAFVSNYQKIRSLTEAEMSVWDIALETAALRFWMLRLVALARKREGGPSAPHHVKDPNTFLNILLARRNDPQWELVKN